jgi:hypothetical protein
VNKRGAEEARVPSEEFDEPRPLMIVGGGVERSEGVPELKNTRTLEH